jgi:hypothetical protein
MCTLPKPYTLAVFKPTIFCSEVDDHLVYYLVFG